MFYLIQSLLKYVFQLFVALVAAVQLVQPPQGLPAVPVNTRPSQGVLHLGLGVVDGLKLILDLLD